MEKYQMTHRPNAYDAFNKRSLASVRISFTVKFT